MWWFCVNRDVWSLSATATIISFASSIFWTILPPYMWDLGFSFWEIAVVYASQSIVMLIFSRPLGIYADSVGKKKFIVSELLVILVAYIFLFCCVKAGYINSLSIAAFSILMGLAWATGSGAFAAAITTSLSREKTGTATGMYVATDSLGWTIGSFVSGFFADVLGIGPTLIISMFVICLGFITISFYHETGERRLISIGKAIRDSWTLSMPSKDNLLVYLFVIVASLNMGAAIFFLVFTIKFYIIVESKTMYGILSGISGLLSMVTPYFLGRLSEKVSKEKILGVAIAVRVLFMSLLVFSWDWLITVIFWITPLWPIITLELVSLTTDYSIDDRESEAHAIRNIVNMVSQTIGSLLGGFMAERFGVKKNVRLMALVLGLGVVVYALGIPLVFILHNRTKEIVRKQETIL